MQVADWEIVARPLSFQRSREWERRRPRWHSIRLVPLEFSVRLIPNFDQRAGVRRVEVWRWKPVCIDPLKGIVFRLRIPLELWAAKFCHSLKLADSKVVGRPALFLLCRDPFHRARYQSGFFAHFTGAGFGRGFTIFNSATRKHVVSSTVSQAAHQEDCSVPFDNGSCSHITPRDRLPVGWSEMLTGPLSFPSSSRWRTHGGIRAGHPAPRCGRVQTNTRAARVHRRSFAGRIPSAWRRVRRAGPRRSSRSPAVRGA